MVRGSSVDLGDCASTRSLVDGRPIHRAAAEAMVRGASLEEAAEETSGAPEESQTDAPSPEAVEPEE